VVGSFAVVSLSWTWLAVFSRGLVIGARGSRGALTVIPRAALIDLEII
jgi:hypothetical protein